jgi:predicted ATP-grasp superfamily ATP-dependent carboligase
LERIVGKDGLYATATRAGVPVPPAIVEPSLADLEQWCPGNPAPYFAKPYYQGIEVAALKEKNRVFATKEELISFVTEHGSRALIVQRKLRGGDGWIFDCYGYCDRGGRVVTLASHRRIRQLPVDTGTTCYGEIPAAPKSRGEQALFDLTTRLLEGLGYHGIFGIEWLQDRETDELYILDFNARPFSTVNHLKDCGLNLPFLAYRDLVGEDISRTPRTPKLVHKTWIGVNRDLVAFRTTRSADRGSWLRWIRDVAGARSFAFFTFRDPGPGVDQLRRLFLRVGRNVRGEL